MLFSVHHYYDRKAKSHVPPENNIITAWVEVGEFYFFSNETYSTFASGGIRHGFLSVGS